MSIYRFSAASPVREITYRYANDRPPVALLHAAPGTGADQLSTIRRALESQGLQCVPADVDGQAVLQVHGFKDEGQLAALLSVQAFVKGTPRITPEAGDHPTRSFKEWLQHNSVRAGGVSYLIGDGALLMSGLMSGRDKEITSGLLYTAGGAVAARYGNVKTEHQLRVVSENLAEFLKKEGDALPEECGLYSILKDKREGKLHSAESFLYRYPSQVTLGVYTLGAFSMLQSGIKYRKFWDIAYGVNSTATKVASLIIPEKKRTEEEKTADKHKGMVGSFVDWVQEKPLRVFGYGSLLSAGLLGLSAYREYQTDPRQKSYIFKFITAGMYTVGDLMFAVSHKNPVNADGIFDTEEKRRIEALAAESIVAQPKQFRDPLVNQAAAFLSTQAEMASDPEHIASAIRAQVAEMEKNPWRCMPSAKSWGKRVSADALPEGGFSGRITP